MLISDRRLAQLIERFERIDVLLAHTGDAATITELSRERSALEGVVSVARQVVAARSELTDLRALSRSVDDREMSALARAEMADITERLESLEAELRLALVPGDPDDTAGVVLEVRAGTGGEEAALFARDLYAMYSRYAVLHGWKVEPTSRSMGDSGGYKEIIALVEGSGVYGRWKHESGVHRVQRIPVTESGGRIHTSAATVAVLPAPERARSIEIDGSDIRIDTMRASGAGGQHVNKTDSAVRITHLPTGLVVTSSEKSQHYNRSHALSTLKARLYERHRRAEQEHRDDIRRGQLGSGDRSERIRTYNFPQGRVSDHRLNLSVRKLEDILSGDALDQIIEPLMAEERGRRLAALESDG